MWQRFDLQRSKAAPSVIVAATEWTRSVARKLSSTCWSGIFRS